MKDFAKTMRGLGAAALVASGVAFMFEGWSTLTSVGKFLSFGGFILALAAAGVFCSNVIRENKGARTFLGLAAAAITAQATQLGAMIYALVHPAKSTLPGILIYEAVNLPIVIGLTGISVVLLMPVAALGFSALVRSQSKLATGLFFALNALLLLPTRMDVQILGLAMAGFALFALAQEKIFRHDPAMQTAEGWILRAIVATPLFALCGRELFYPISGVASGMLLIAFGLGLFSLARILPVARSAGLAIQGLSLPFLFIGWSSIIGELAPRALLLYLLPPCWMLIGLSYVSLGSGRLLRGGGALLGVFACACALFQGPGMMNATILMANGVILLMLAFATEEFCPLYAGIVSFLLGMAYSLFTALSHYAWGSWIGLALIGGAVLLLSSYLERNRERLVLLYGGFRQRTAGWR